MKNSILKKATIAVVCSMLVCTSCSASWVGEAEQIVAALIPATANLLALIATLEGKDVSAADLATIQTTGLQAEADLQLVKSLISEYEKADATAQPGLLSQIQGALATVQSNLNGLLPALHMEDAATAAKESAVIGVLISEAQSMAAIVPLVSASRFPALESAVERRASRIAPLTAEQFVSSYNATMTAKTGNAELDRATSALKIHSHGKLERWASAGLLK